MQLPSLQIDLSSIVVAVTGFIIVTLAKRAIKNFDNSFETIHTQIADVKSDNSVKFQETHTKMDTQKQELTTEIKEVKGDLVKHRDRTENLVTSTRLDLENKIEVHDERIRNLEINNNHTQEKK